MARGGINKALVIQARDALLAKGKNPSIDAVRVELGNTGSKSTIHRYLRELEEEEGTRLEDEALLSKTLKEIIARLASQLHEEANNIVKQEEERHQVEIQTLKQQNESLQKEVVASKTVIAEQENKLKKTVLLHTEALENYQQATLKVQRLEQQIVDTKSHLDEKDKRIESLEEKHRHGRESLEHYRASVKEQRDQEQRRHEQQIQQLQGEQRQLNQTLSIKQTDITQLNKDNARLVAQLGESRKSILTCEQKSEQTEKKLLTAENEGVSLSKKLTLAENNHHTLEIKLAKLKSELDVKNEIFKKIGRPEK